MVNGDNIEWEPEIRSYENDVFKIIILHTLRHYSIFACHSITMHLESIPGWCIGKQAQHYAEGLTSNAYHYLPN